MIDTVATILAARLRTLQFLSLVAGIARAQKIDIGSESKTIKTLPAYPKPNNPREYDLLSPDSDQSGIAYFENLGNEQDGEVSAGRAFRYRAKLRLVVWLNTKRLAPIDVGVMMSACVSVLQGRQDDSGLVSYIRVQPDREATRSADLFGRYTYDEAETQYLMLPFEYFAFDFDVWYVLATGCPLPNVIRTAEQC